MPILQNPNSNIKQHSTTQVNLINKKETCVEILMMIERCILDGHDCNANFYKYKTLCKESFDNK